jgi:hypothetical protein
MDDAADLLNRMAAVYAGLDRYIDEGVVLSTFIRDDQRRLVRKPFRTAFERPHRFRYEFTGESPWQRLVIWQENPPAKLFWTVQPEVRTLTLAMAIASATGISDGSALSVPRLLMPDLIKARSLTDIAAPMLCGEQVVDGVACLCIQGRHGGSAIELSVGASDLLVRRIFETHHFERSRRIGPFDTETETRYRPRTDLDLQPSDFAPGIDH